MISIGAPGAVRLMTISFCRGDYSIEELQEQFKKEAAIEKAEKSPGPQYAPEKIAKARELGKKAVETYWDCRPEESMALLAEARRLALRAELTNVPPRTVPAPAAVAPEPAKEPPPPSPAAPAPVAVAPAPKKVIILKGASFGFNSASSGGVGRTSSNFEEGTRYQGGDCGSYRKHGSGPIGPNDTTEGRAINRRVELNVLE